MYMYIVIIIVVVAMGDHGLLNSETVAESERITQSVPTK